MKLSKLMAALTVAFLLAVTLGTPAQARHHHYRHHVARHASYAHSVNSISPSFCRFDNDEHQACAGVSEAKISYGYSSQAVENRHGSRSYDDGRIVGHPSGCPSSAFCGCGVSVRIFGHPVRNLYLASNWFKFPPATPGPGMVAVRNHHVMVIEAIDANGNAVVYDPNSGGHQTRIHTRSLAGYRVVNPHGA